MSAALEIFFFVLAGVVTGFASGLLGIGGGVISVPFLVFFLPYIYFPQDYVMHGAIATSLATVVPTAFASAIGHYRKGAIQFKLFKQMALGIAIGGLIGAQFADILTSNILQIVFACFVFLMAYRLIRRENPSIQTKTVPGHWVLQISGLIIAFSCTLLGVGGGSFFVPYFTYYQIPIKNAVATSAACGVFVAIFGVIGLSTVGKVATLYMPYTTGYIYWPAFFWISLASIPFALLGVRLAHEVSTHLLRKIFAALLLFVGVDMLYKAIY